jgi:hypothetical protein
MLRNWARRAAGDIEQHGEARSRTRGLGPFASGHLTIIVVTLMVVVGFPFAATAVTGSNSFITDAVSGNQASVQTNRLRVDTRLPIPNTSKIFYGPNSFQSTVKRTLGTITLPTTFAFQHFENANPSASTAAVVTFSSYQRMSGSESCLAALGGTAPGYSSGYPYTVVVVPPGQTVTDDFGPNGINLGFTGIAGGNLLCPYVQASGAAPYVTVLLSTA